MQTEPAPPAWLRLADGRLVPFDADRVCGSLFAATERLGQADAFLARELTDAVLHFLAAEDEAVPTAARLGELIEKVVRELGHPRLAQCYAEGRRAAPPTPAPTPAGPDVAGWLAGRPTPEALLHRAAGASLNGYALREVFPPELAAAHRDGVLDLGGLETPLELAGCVLGPPPRPRAPGLGMLEAIEAGRCLAGEFAAMDGPDWALAAAGGEPDLSAAEFARELRAALRWTGLACVANLNTAEPPAWAQRGSGGPLFADLADGQSAAPAPEAEALLRALLAPGPDDEAAGGAADPGPGRIRVSWHLTPADLHGPPTRGLATALRHALAGDPVEFCFDRARRPVALAEGLDRRQPAVLLVVGVRLDRLAAAAGASAFPAKLASLARLAKGAGRARLAYLRRHARPATQRGFLLDRARLVVVPVGLEAAARRLCGSGTCEDGPALEAAAGWLRILRETLESDPPRSLAACLDGPPVPLRTDSATPLDAGVTPADPDAAPRKQARAASALQGAAGGGCGVVLLPADKPFAPEDALSALREAGRHAETVRLRFVRAFPPGRQLTAGW